ncbi:MAG: hypothetical protein Greene041619_797 [Candidatus Peregrinibacteria bacterium Greene0416_19]|nr:MAG: hypothetical protein Greene041619_797 [Candidatus Peregrinibacteria bacterium Greene0416_19]
MSFSSAGELPPQAQAAREFAKPQAAAVGPMRPREMLPMPAAAPPGTEDDWTRLRIPKVPDCAAFATQEAHSIAALQIGLTDCAARVLITCAPDQKEQLPPPRRRTWHPFIGLLAEKGEVPVPEPHTVPMESLFSLRDRQQQIAIEELQTLDRRENRYILARKEDYPHDLRLLRWRFRDLKAAPFVEDSYRFPDRPIVNDLLALNRAYRQHLDVRQSVELRHWWEIRAAMQETQLLYNIWDKVRDARCDYYYITVRRKALLELRELLGYEDYYAGDLPPVVPTWRFRRVERPPAAPSPSSIAVGP